MNLMNGEFIITSSSPRDPVTPSSSSVLNRFSLEAVAILRDGMKKAMWPVVEDWFNELYRLGRADMKREALVAGDESLIYGPSAVLKAVERVEIDRVGRLNGEVEVGYERPRPPSRLFGPGMGRLLDV